MMAFRWGQWVKKVAEVESGWPTDPVESQWPTDLVESQWPSDSVESQWPNDPDRDSVTRLSESVGYQPTDHLQLFTRH